MLLLSLLFNLATSFPFGYFHLFLSLSFPFFPYFPFPLFILIWYPLILSLLSLPPFLSLSLPSFHFLPFISFRNTSIYSSVPTPSISFFSLLPLSFSSFHRFFCALSPPFSLILVRKLWVRLQTLIFLFHSRFRSFCFMSFFMSLSGVHLGGPSSGVAPLLPTQLSAFWYIRSFIVAVKPSSDHESKLFL